jgi:hypothetical protein
MKNLGSQIKKIYKLKVFENGMLRRIFSPKREDIQEE